MNFGDMYQEYEDTEAYAKLQGPNIKEFITKKVVILGREPGEPTEEEQKIFSKKHLNIENQLIQYDIKLFLMFYGLF